MAGVEHLTSDRTSTEHEASATDTWALRWGLDARTATWPRRLTPNGERNRTHTMKIRFGLISWATGTLLLVAVSACGEQRADPPPSPPTLPPRPSSPTSQRVTDLAVGRSHD